jgi:hypothetical protein
VSAFPPKTSPSLAVALAHGARGRRVFPAVLGEPDERGHRSKTPLVAWKDEATCDPEAIRRMWRQHRQANLAGWALDGGLVALDVDDPAAFDAAGLELPATASQRTPSGGSHYLYEADGRAVRQTVREIPGADTRVAGKGWVGLYSEDAFAGRIAPAPEFLYGIERPPDGGDGGDGDERLGTRDDILRWLGRVARAAGATEAEYLALLTAARDGGRIVALDPDRPWRDADLRVLAREAAKWGSDGPDEELEETARRLWEGYLAWKGARAAASVPTRFDFMDLGAAMRDGIRQAPMLLEGWLPREVIVWLAAEDGAGKTWLCLWWAAQAIRAGRTVLYIDQELGGREVAQRLTALGLAPDEVSERLRYLHSPGLAMADVKAFAQLCESEAFDLAIFDPATDFLAEAGIKENDGDAVTRWVKAFPEQVRIHGGTAVVPDHVVKSGETRGHPVASRAKRAKSKLAYELLRDRGFDRETVGRVRLSVTKNSLSAPVAKERYLEIGPLGGPGTFGIREADGPRDDWAGAIEGMAGLIEARLREAGASSFETGVSQRALIGLLPGNAAMKRQAAQYAAGDPRTRVRSRPVGNSIKYWVSEPEGVGP